MTDWQPNVSWRDEPWRNKMRRDGSSRDGSPCRESKACKCYKNDQSIIRLKNKVEYLERGLDWLRKQITEKRHEDLQYKPTRDKSECKESKSVTHTCYKNNQLIMQLKSKVKYLEHRIDWSHQQIIEIKHEKLKRQKILDYERQHAETMKCKSKQAPSFDSRSESSSKSSSYDRHTEKKWKSETMDSEFVNSEPDVTLKKLDGYTDRALSSFKDSKYQPINTTEIPGVNVDIHRNTPAQKPITEIRTTTKYNYFNLTPGT